ncbi:MAG: c-type cytochrome domain-containing protein [Pontiella sp.]
MKRSRLILTAVAGTLVSALLLLMPVMFPLTGTSGPDSVAAIGRFHILALHFPIALILLIPLFEVIGSFTPFKHVKQAVPVLLVLAILFAVKVCILGYMLASGEGDSGGLLVTHMWGGIISTVLLIIAFILHQLPPSTAATVAYFGFLGLSIISLIIGSHNGASLVHGEDYLYAKISPSIQNLFSGNTDKEPVTMDSSVYDALIKPIFEERCYLCHYENKQKGDFRLDDFELMLLGGESGMSGVVPGDLDASEVHYRITLDPKKKGFMPPEGNDPLTVDQIALIRWWIEGGAPTDKSIAELSADRMPDVVQRLIQEADKCDSVK